MSLNQPNNDPPCLTRAQARTIDRIAMDELGIPGIVLMENAGINATDIATGMLQAREGNTVAIVCGGGNNGGDGYVIARHLANAGRVISIYSTVPTDTLTGDAAINHGICRAMALPIRAIDQAARVDAAATQWASTDLIIDAVLGTGFAADRGLSPHAAAVISAINGAGQAEGGPYALAIDVPSGLDCDTGQPSPPTVRADATATFVARKIGFDAPEAADYLGQVFVLGIGVPHGLIQRAKVDS